MASNIDDSNCEMCQATSRCLAHQLYYYQKSHKRDVRLDFRDYLADSMKRRICPDPPLHSEPDILALPSHSPRIISKKDYTVFYIFLILICIISVLFYFHSYK
jgi:hypothetical protein